MKLPDEIREYFAKQGRIGALKRKANMTPEQRSESARIAAQSRWANSKPESKTANKSKRTGGTK